ncbi:Uromodulin-like 1 [Paramuricea clavata]|uniref:Uromodulin-like 1 n=1 Tax=Paramuricea clavata TaxID=317549 RepID=A0A7D9E443_PARCT|nr:Uromodulin-like 1 [Paramuricea clavata]
MASVQGQIRIVNREFKAAYNNRKSLAYFKITQTLIIELSRLYRRTSTLSLKFHSIFIIRLFQGSVGVDYVATFNDTTGVNNEMIQEELVGVLNATKNGTFIGDSDLKISNKTDLNEVANELTFQDYDECNPPDIIHTPDCGNNATCVNRNMSYDCVCDEGFANDGTGCILLLAQRNVDKNELDEVRAFVIAVIVWLVLCFLIAFILVVIAGLNLCKVPSERHTVRHRYEETNMPRNVTTPSHRSSAVTDAYDYYGDEIIVY